MLHNRDTAVIMSYLNKVKVLSALNFVENRLSKESDSHATEKRADPSGGTHSQETSNKVKFSVDIECHASEEIKGGPTENFSNKSKLNNSKSDDKKPLAVSGFSPRVNLELLVDEEDDLSIYSASNNAFTVYQRCMYLQIQGDSYNKLYVAGGQQRKILNEFAQRALSSYEAATDLASSSLDATEPLRLLVVCSYCHALCALPNPLAIRGGRRGRKKARRIATETFNIASAHGHYLQKSSIMMLQSLRDLFIAAPVSNEEAEETDSNSEQSLSDSVEDESNSDEEEIVNENRKTNDVEKRMLTAKENKKNGKRNSNVVTYVERKDEDGSIAPLRIKAALKRIRRLRRLTMNIPKPTYLDKEIAHASHIKAALKRIFGVYVQGSALAGAMTHGYNVEMGDGKTISIGDFLLTGPYIGFRGFAGILRDFGIAKVPRNAQQIKGRTKFGKYYGDGKFPNIFDPKGSLHLYHNHSHPLSIKEATLLFMECSRSSRPSFTMTKFQKDYAEIAEQAGAFEDSFSIPQEWAAQECDKWGEVTQGLNFMQFLDFIGKAALVAYSSEDFDAVLPTPKDKIEHFLHAQLGLLDQRRWMPKVEGRVHALKSLVKEIQDKQRIISVDQLDREKYM